MAELWIKFSSLKKKILPICYKQHAKGDQVLVLPRCERESVATVAGVVSAADRVCPQKITKCRTISTFKFLLVKSCARFFWGVLLFCSMIRLVGVIFFIAIRAICVIQVRRPNFVPIRCGIG